MTSSTVDADRLALDAAGGESEKASSPSVERRAMRPARRRRFPLRAWLRAFHRDVGYFIVGLTVVYALSGLAVNHIATWDPSFKQIERTHHVAGPFPADEQGAADRVLHALKVAETPREVYRADNQRIEIVFDKKTLHLDPTTGTVLEEGQEPRFFLRLANWLHLNRGKKAWTIIADGYAVLLLFLAFSGLFMLPGRKGLIGRGAIVAAIGAAVPIAYVTLSGGPNAPAARTVPAASPDR